MSTAYLKEAEVIRWRWLDHESNMMRLDVRGYYRPWWKMFMRHDVVITYIGAGALWSHESGTKVLNPQTRLWLRDRYDILKWENPE